MSLFTRPKVRYEAPDGASSPIEATLQTDGRIRLLTDPDSGHLNGAWLTPAELRELLVDLAGLADASDIIHHDPADISYDADSPWCQDHGHTGLLAGCRLCDYLVRSDARFAAVLGTEHNPDGSRR
jgi:hypothetical protein